MPPTGKGERPQNNGKTICRAEDRRWLQLITAIPSPPLPFYAQMHDAGGGKSQNIGGGGGSKKMYKKADCCSLKKEAVGKIPISRATSVFPPHKEKKRGKKEIHYFECEDTFGRWSEGGQFSAGSECQVFSFSVYSFRKCAGVVGSDSNHPEPLATVQWRWGGGREREYPLFLLGFIVWVKRRCVH